MGIAIATHSACGGVVGVDAVGAKADVGHTIQRGGRFHHDQGGDGPPGDVGSYIQIGGNVAESETAVTLRPRPDHNLHRLAHWRGHEFFVSGKGETYRLTCFTGHQGGNRFVRVNIQPSAKRAANSCLDDANLAAGDVECLGQIPL